MIVETFLQGKLGKLLGRFSGLALTLYKLAWNDIAHSFANGQWSVSAHRDECAKSLVPQIEPAPDKDAEIDAEQD